MLEYAYQLPDYLKSKAPQTSPVRREKTEMIDEALLKLNHYERLNVLRYIREEALPMNETEYTPFVYSLLDRIPAMEGDVSSQNLIYQYAMMKKHGEKIFTVSPNLADMLLNTTIKGVSGSMLKTPYPSMYIEVPRGLLTLTDAKTGEHQMEGMYVHKSASEIRVLAVGSPNANSSNMLDDCFTYFRLPIEDTDLHEQLAAFVEFGKNDALVRAFGGIYNLHKVPKIFLFLMNILLYATSPEREAYFESWVDIDKNIKNVNSKNRKEYLRRLKSRGRFLHIRLGEHAPFLGGSDGQRTHQSQTLVMGHWQHYWYGARASEARECRLKWKEPFWKGEGPITNTPHKLV